MEKLLTKIIIFLMGITLSTTSFNFTDNNEVEKKGVLQILQ